MLEELANFRKRVRLVTLTSLKNGSQSETDAEVMKICDQLRDHLAAMKGVHLIDSSEDVSWRYCIPHDTSASERQTISPFAPKPQEVLDIPINELFKSGRYQGLFSEYDNDGFPTKNADGSSISNRQKKKLLTKKEKHLIRISAKDVEKDS
jgi:hypothetical protein